jgi:peptidoglycan hydrolase-like protein with peptidoglycan-binding domain
LHTMIRRLAVPAIVLGAVVATFGTSAVANAAPVSTKAASGCVTSQFRQGSTGNCVKYIQQIQAITADGIFGPATRANIVAFQRGYGLTADGIVGKNTWRYLCVPLDGPSWSAAQKNAGCMSLY